MTSHIRQKLLSWYEEAHRDLPWRRTRDPYAIWISEIMLQQTRVAAVIPFYYRFLERFPDIESLAAAPEADLLACWSGLGYYSRVRNMQNAARQMNGRFPADYDAIRALAGVGDYTAAAVASIAYGLPHAVLDGNVIRVLSRLTNNAGDVGDLSTRRQLQQAAGQLLDAKQPGLFNQAVMELGATVCLPRQPQCLLCPIAEFCRAKHQGTAGELPVKVRKTEPVKLQRTVLVIQRDGGILMWRRPDDSRKLAGFWELPEPHLLPSAEIGVCLGEFRHSITNHNYVFCVSLAEAQRIPRQFKWVSAGELQTLPLSTTSRKALTLFRKSSE
ncbi:MAG: A/G-specific adenine glycosylase [Bryobacteraceae bacterium]